MWRKWFWSLVDAILPRHPHATAARKVAERSLAEIMSPQILRGVPWLHTLFPYHDDEVRSVIKAVKYYGERDVASTMSALAADYVVDVLADLTALSGWSDVVVVPVPSSPARLRERGYNQVELFAQVIAEWAGLPYEPEYLTREDRQSQVRVMRSRRRANIAGAFTATPEVVGRFIVLIDDVAESGATLADARRALLEAGAKDVIAVAMAH